MAISDIANTPLSRMSTNNNRMDVSMDVFPGATIVGAPVYRFKQAFWSGIRANVQLCRRGAGGPDIIGRDNFVHGGDAVVRSRHA